MDSEKCCPNCGYTEFKRINHCGRCKKIGQNTEYSNFCHKCNTDILHKRFECERRQKSIDQEFIKFCQGEKDGIQDELVLGAE